jgi:hypothetical protein
LKFLLVLLTIPALALHFLSSFVPGRKWTRWRQSAVSR